MNRSLREAAARRAPTKREAPIHVPSTMRQAQANPLQLVLDLQDEAVDSVKELKTEAPEAAKHLSALVAHCKAMEPHLRGVRAEWTKAIAAFKEFQGEIGDPSLERKFKAATAAMAKIGLGPH